MSDIKPTTRTALKTFRARAYVTMGTQKAGMVPKSVKDKFALRRETVNLVHSLTTQGYFTGKRLLKKTLSNIQMTINISLNMGSQMINTVPGPVKTPDVLCGKTRNHESFYTKHRYYPSMIQPNTLLLRLPTDTDESFSIGLAYEDF